MKDSTEYLRAGDIVALTGMSIRTVRRWIADETIPSTKLGGTRFVAKVELQRLLCTAADQVDEPDDAAE
jgi:predicted DNA-binding transcriptional regulator AlpA